ncbi:hypothetical protein LINPERHAP2_LOCUS13200 [Linum perenne]
MSNPIRDALEFPSLRMKSGVSTSHGPRLL